MSDRSPIEWTDATWNPVRGCTKVSPGCKHCYAETFAERFRGVSGHPFEFGFDLRLVPEKLEQPLHWRRPRKIFVNSMSDMFHEAIPTAYIARVGDVMRRADWPGTACSQRLERRIGGGTSCSVARRAARRLDMRRAAPKYVRVPAQAGRRCHHTHRGSDNTIRVPVGSPSSPRGLIRIPLTRTWLYSSDGCSIAIRLMTRSNRRRMASGRSTN